MTDAPIAMRPSRVLRKMRAGQVAICAKINLADPRVVEIAGLCGFDCVWLDVEHVPNTLHDIENQIRAAKMHDVDAMVRVQRGGYSDLIHPLEMDAAGIMVPHVMSAADAREVAWRTKFHPVGRRPWDGGNADGAYCLIPAKDYLRQANEQRFVCVQIEDPEPVAELDAIAAVEGVDMLLFGPGDFSHAIGAAGQMAHPEVEKLRKRVAEVARKHGKFAAAVGGPGDVPRLVDMGYQFINITADVVVLGQTWRPMLEGLARK